VKSGNGSSTHAALWEPDNIRPRDLGTLSGGTNSAANAVNYWGDVVGFSETFDAPRRAFLYTNGKLEDLERSLSPRPLQFLSAQPVASTMPDGSSVFHPLCHLL
jgi:probable HAF family extracellular repeat protein